MTGAVAAGAADAGVRIIVQLVLEQKLVGERGVSWWRWVPVGGRYKGTVRRDAGYWGGIVATAEILRRWTRKECVISTTANAANATTVQQQTVVTAEVLMATNVSPVPRVVLQCRSHNRRSTPVVNRRSNSIAVKQPVQLSVQRIPQIRRVKLPDYRWTRRMNCSSSRSLGLLYHTGVGRFHGVVAAVTAATV